MDKKQKYEMLTILDPNLSSEETDSLIETIGGMITKIQGAVEKTSKWGRKKLAYEIKKFNEGFYVLTDFSAPPAGIAEIDRLSKINDGIIRHLIVKKEKGE